MFSRTRESRQESAHKILKLILMKMAFHHHEEELGFAQLVVRRMYGGHKTTLGFCSRSNFAGFLDLRMPLGNCTFQCLGFLFKNKERLQKVFYDVHNNVQLFLVWSV